MARTQSVDYADRRQAMLDTAAELYGSKGFLGTSIADLASAWGISKSLLYHYFSSKDDILYEIMSTHMRDLTEMAQSADAAPAAEERIRALTHGFLNLYVGASAKHKVLINELDKLPEARRAQIVKDQRELIRIVRTTLQELHISIGGDPARLQGLTMLYFGMINWTHTWYEPSGALSPAELAEMVVALIQS